MNIIVIIIFSIFMATQLSAVQEKNPFENIKSQIGKRVKESATNSVEDVQKKNPFENIKSQQIGKRVKESAINSVEDVQEKYKKLYEKGPLSLVKKEDQRIGTELLKYVIRYQKAQRNEVELETETNDKDVITFSFYFIEPEAQELNTIPKNAAEVFGINSLPHCNDDDLQYALAWAYMRRICGPENDVLGQGAIATFGIYGDDLEVFIKSGLEKDINGYIRVKKELYEQIQQEVGDGE